MIVLVFIAAVIAAIWFVRRRSGRARAARAALMVVGVVAALLGGGGLILASRGEPTIQNYYAHNGDVLSRSQYDQLQLISYVFIAGGVIALVLGLVMLTTGPRPTSAITAETKRDSHLGEDGAPSPIQDNPPTADHDAIC